jgi:hypothetical protein
MDNLEPRILVCRNGEQEGTDGLEVGDTFTILECEWLKSQQIAAMYQFTVLKDDYFGLHYDGTLLTCA